MLKNQHEKKLVSPDIRDKYCIWMTAGVISYKLCPFEFDCENCELDASLRQKDKNPEIKIDQQKLD